MKVKNKIKQILSIIVIAMMMMSLFTVNAFAVAGNFDDTKTQGTIKVLPPTGVTLTGAKYSAYQILTATKGNNVYKYSVAGKFTGLIGEGKAYQLTESGQILKAGTSISSSEDATKEFAAAVEGYISTVNGDADTSNDISPVVGNFDINTAQAVGFGYYLVLQVAGNDAWVQNTPILVDVPKVTSETDGNKFDYEYDINITQKGTTPTVTKKIVENGSEVDKNDVNIGDDVEYKVVADVTKYSPNATGIKYYLIDTLSKGLTFKNDDDTVDPKVQNVEIYGVKGTIKTKLTKTTDYTITVTPGTDSTEIKFDFTYANIKDYDKVELSYEATLNKNAVVGVPGNPNKVELNYTNNPYSKEEHKTETPEVVTYTYKVNVHKVDATDNANLAGAEFKLQKKDGTEYKDIASVYILKDGVAKLVGEDGLTATTDNDGNLVFTGLDEGEYQLVETKAPSGYVIPTNNTTKFKIAASSPKDGEWNVTNDTDEVFADKTITIENSKGLTLPTTGGAGTWMFTIGGLLLMVGAIVVFAVNRKKAN